MFRRLPFFSPASHTRINRKGRPSFRLAGGAQSPHLRLRATHGTTSAAQSPRSPLRLFARTHRSSFPVILLPDRDISHMMASEGPLQAKSRVRNKKNLTLPSPKLASKPESSAADAQVPGSRASHNLNSLSADDTIRPDPVVGDLSEQMATLELGVEFKLDLRQEDLKTIERLGAGNGGTVSKVMHIPTKTIMAKKVLGPFR